MATMIVRSGTFLTSAAFHSRPSRYPRVPFLSSLLTPTACQVPRPDCAHRDPNEHPVARDVASARFMRVFCPFPAGRRGLARQQTLHLLGGQYPARGVVDGSAEGGVRGGGREHGG